MFGIKVVLLFVVAFATAAYSLLLGDDNTQLSDGHQKIFGGYLAAEGQFPYQASLRVNFSRTFEHNCGGSIITNRFILTAAHCFPEQYSNKTEMFQIVLGAHNISGDGTTFGVEQIFIHPGWNASILIHDIGLAFVNQTIEFSFTIAPIRLSREFISTSYRAVTSGWGRTNDPVTTLKYAYLYTLTNDECRTRINRPRARVHDFSTLCGFSVRVGTGICSGDSGGPLAFRGELIGITSWAYLCALGIPDGFCRISVYVDWVEEQIISTATQPLP